MVIMHMGNPKEKSQSLYIYLSNQADTVLNTKTFQPKSCPLCESKDFFTWQCLEKSNPNCLTVCA